MIEETNKINIPLAFDYKFKKMFGDNDNIERLETLICLYFELKKEDVHGKIRILNNENLIENRKNRTC